MRGTVLTLLAATLTTGLLTAQEAPPVDRITGGDALVKERGRFKETWVHPDALITRYGKVHLWELGFRFREVGETESRGTSSAIIHGKGRKLYALPPEQQARLEEVFMDEFAKELGRSKRYELVDEAAPDTLLLRGAVFDIVSLVPPPTARASVYLAVIGEANVVFELIDPETGLMQARVGERSAIRSPKHAHDTFERPMNYSTMWPEVRRWARRVASQLRRELDDRYEEAAGRR